MKKEKTSLGIKIKKQFGQHFLRDQSVVDTMLDNVELRNSTSVFEIGCGDGFLTRSILQNPIERLWIFEIDPDWATYITKNITDDRMVMHQTDFLDVDQSIFQPHAPWTILSNLPYQVTFPILHKFVEMKSLISEGVIMVQDEVAEKIVKKHGRGYGFVSLFFQYHFTWKKLVKIPPTAFFPPPKVNSRLLYFKPREHVEDIPDIAEFWKYIKLVFHQPRRTLRNNLVQSHFDLDKVPAHLHTKRAQELTFEDLISIWNLIRNK
jgi:16S rRNA (adenine1518-N6/adenine1519-N6)-dimethyltransferase